MIRNVRVAAEQPVVCIASVQAPRNLGAGNTVLLDFAGAWMAAARHDI